MSKDTGGPAFPAQDHHGQKFTGMTLRDYFAAKAVQGLLAQSMGTALYSSFEQAAEYSYALADAMLEARGEK